jgi:hypothetical protein
VSSPAVAPPDPARSATPAGPFKSPSYPQRTHFAERTSLEEKLRTWDERIGAAAQKLSTLTNHPQRPDYERLYHQMQGARDQMADAVRRMPLEAGALYLEDRERLEWAEEALSRVFERWNGMKS